jgi:hypothetical protein
MPVRAALVWNDHMRRWERMGTAGSVGPKGDKGDTGPKGDKGDKGDQGEPGSLTPEIPIVIDHADKSIALDIGWLDRRYAGGGGGGSYAYRVVEVDEVQRIPLQNSDLRRGVAIWNVNQDADNVSALTIPFLSDATEGDWIELNVLTGAVIVAGDGTHVIYRSSDNDTDSCYAVPGPTRLICVGTEGEEQSWIVTGFILGGPDEPGSKPVITSADGIDSAINVSWSYEEAAVPLRCFRISVTPVAGGETVTVTVDRDARTHMIRDLVNRTQYSIVVSSVVDTAKDPVDSDPVVVETHGQVPDPPVLAPAEGTYEKIDFSVTAPVETYGPITGWKFWWLNDDDVWVDSPINDIKTEDGITYTFSLPLDEEDIFTDVQIAVTAANSEGDSPRSNIIEISAGPQLWKPAIAEVQMSATDPRNVVIFNDEDVLPIDYANKGVNVSLNKKDGPSYSKWYYPTSPGIEIDPVEFDTEYTVTIQFARGTDDYSVSTMVSDPVAFKTPIEYSEAAPSEYTVDTSPEQGVIVTVDDDLEYTRGVNSPFLKFPHMGVNVRINEEIVKSNDLEVRIHEGFTAEPTDVRITWQEFAGRESKEAVRTVDIKTLLPGEPVIKRIDSNIEAGTAKVIFDPPAINAASVAGYFYELTTSHGKLPLFSLPADGVISISEPTGSLSIRLVAKDSHGSRGKYSKPMQFSWVRPDKPLPPVMNVTFSQETWIASVQVSNGLNIPGFNYWTLFKTVNGKVTSENHSASETTLSIPVAEGESLLLAATVTGYKLTSDKSKAAGPFVRPS